MNKLLNALTFPLKFISLCGSFSHATTQALWSFGNSHIALWSFGNSLNALWSVFSFSERFQSLSVAYSYKQLMLDKEIHVSIGSSYVTSTMCMIWSIMDWL